MHWKAGFARNNRNNDYEIGIKLVPNRNNDYAVGIKLVGCKHRASEGVFYIGGRGFVCQIIEPVTFARCAFIKYYQ